MNDFELACKVVLVGDSTVGKSSILSRYVNNLYSSSNVSTIGVDFHLKNINIDGRIIRLQIWDTAGQERFRSLTQGFYRGAQGICLVFDVTREDTFQRLGNWVKEIENFAKDCVVYLIGNKIDLDAKRMVSKETAEQFAKSYNLKYFESSAKDDTGMSLFESLTRDMLRKRNREENKQIDVQNNKNLESSFFNCC
ncbi:Rab GTPase [Tieghemostelium lacteum]|uniref:Rab GTPase n=1 Tax=Tieghemostelium lacteum TaxID=361077 RepID=A0A151Z4C5_TIELA|nr:Rab GTPase [Tieghemostelium lacteum]|eukprot:KYQ88767.1 Rab GTPase [Tieghemostelium lacteum]